MIFNAILIRFHFKIDSTNKNSRSFQNIVWSNVKTFGFGMKRQNEKQINPNPYRPIANSLFDVSIAKLCCCVNGMSFMDELWMRQAQSGFTVRNCLKKMVNFFFILYELNFVCRRVSCKSIKMPIKVFSIL